MKDRVKEPRLRCSAVSPLQMAASFQPCPAPPSVAWWKAPSQRVSGLVGPRTHRGEAGRRGLAVHPLPLLRQCLQQGLTPLCLPPPSERPLVLPVFHPWGPPMDHLHLRLWSGVAVALCCCCGLGSQLLHHRQPVPHVNSLRVCSPLGTLQCPSRLLARPAHVELSPQTLPFSSSSFYAISIPLSSRNSQS